jgi:hypothetical protein
VQRREEEKRQMQFFMREGSLFEDRPLRLIPEQLRSDIEERVGELDVSVLAQPEIANSPPSMLTPPSPHPESRPEPSNDMGKLVTATSPQPYYSKGWLPSPSVLIREVSITRIAVSPREAVVVGKKHSIARGFSYCDPPKCRVEEVGLVDANWTREKELWTRKLERRLPNISD